MTTVVGIASYLPASLLGLKSLIPAAKTVDSWCPSAVILAGNCPQLKINTSPLVMPLSCRWAACIQWLTDESIERPVPWPQFGKALKGQLQSSHVISWDLFVTIPQSNFFLLANSAAFLTQKVLIPCTLLSKLPPFSLHGRIHFSEEADLQWWHCTGALPAYLWTSW